MPNPFAKSRTKDNPYAIFRAGDFEWRLLKTYRMAKHEAKDPYARWFVAAKSDNTFGSFELGDTYRSEVLRYGTLYAAEPEWLEAYGITKEYIPTPAELLARES